GYDVGDDAASLGISLAAGGVLPNALRGSPDVVVGLVALGLDGVPYNAAVHVRAGAVFFRHPRVYLPTYGMFDEGRFFGRGAPGGRGGGVAARRWGLLGPGAEGAGGEPGGAPGRDPGGGRRARSVDRRRRRRPLPDERGLDTDCAKHGRHLRYLRRAREPGG